jgi:uncharacterized protein
MISRQIPSPLGEIASVIHAPDVPTDRLAILCPGYLDSKDHPHLVALADALSAKGYTVVRFDPIGTWESGGDTSLYTTTNYLKNIQDILDVLLNERSYDEVLVGGHSRGGRVSLLSAARDLRITYVLAIEPSVKLFMQGDRRARWKEQGFEVVQRDLPDGSGTKEFQVSYAHVEDADRYDLVEDVKRIHVPLILIAGELDAVATPEQVSDIFEHANEPKTYRILPGIGHDYRRNAEQIAKVNEAILDELKKSIPESE